MYFSYIQVSSILLKIIIIFEDLLNEKNKNYKYFIKK